MKDVINQYWLKEIGKTPLMIDLRLTVPSFKMKAKNKQKIEYKIVFSHKGNTLFHANLKFKSLEKQLK